MKSHITIPLEDYPCLQDLIRENATIHSSRIFLSIPAENQDITYSEIICVWEKGAGFLQNGGVKKGDKIILSLEDSTEYIIALGSVILAGAVPVLINPTTSIEQIKDLTDICEADHAICLHNIGGLQNYPKSSFSYKKISKYTYEYTPTDNKIDDLAYIVFTSGTTGIMKGTQIDHSNMLYELGSMIRAYGLDKDDVHLCILPLYHASALYRNFLMPFCLGARTVIGGKFNPRAFWELIKKYKVHFVQIVPTNISLLLENQFRPDKETCKLLRYIGTASAPCPTELINRFEKQFNIPIIEGYGLTETTCGATLNPPTKEERKIGSVGKPLDIANIEIVDETGNIQKPHVEGEIRISGALVSRGYINPDDQKKHALQNNTILTGDIGYLDNDGFIYIVGRKSDMIYRGGFKISPTEVEEKLLENPAIGAAIVFSVPNEILGEDIIAYINPTTDDSFNEIAVRQFLYQNLINYKVPTRIISAPGFFENITFKISRLDVRAHYLESKGGLLTESLDSSKPIKKRAFLVGETIYLRPTTDADVTSTRYLDNIMTREYQFYTMSGRFPQSEASIREHWASIKLPDAMTFAICDLATDEYVGHIALRIDWITRNTEFGRMIFKEYQKSTYSIEALELVMQYVFEDLRLHRLWGGGANPSSVPSLIKLGFTLEGRLRKHGFLGGEWRDLFQMGILEEEYFAIKEGKQINRPTSLCSPDILKKVILTVSKAFSLDPSNLERNSGPDSIEGWDSFGTMVLWSYLEEDFKVDITANDMIWAISIENIAIMLEGKLNE